jgi:hypothetical protein
VSGPSVPELIKQTEVDEHSTRGGIFLLMSHLGALIGSDNILTCVANVVHCKIIAYKLSIWQ